MPRDLKSYLPPHCLMVGIQLKYTPLLLEPIAHCRCHYLSMVIRCCRWSLFRCARQKQQHFPCNIKSQLWVVDVVTRLHDKLLPSESLQLCIMKSLQLYSGGSCSTSLTIPQVSCFGRWMLFLVYKTSSCHRSLFSCAL